MTAADVWKVLLGAVLAVAGGFLGQLFSNYLANRRADEEVLFQMNDELTILYQLARGNFTGDLGAAETGRVQALRELVSLVFKLRSRRHRKVGIAVWQLSIHEDFLFAESTVESALRMVQNALNPRLKRAYERNTLTKEMDRASERRR